MSDEFTATAEAPKIRIEPPNIHIDVHVHLAGASSAAPTPAFRDPHIEGGAIAAPPAKRPLLTVVLVAGGILITGFVGYRAGANSSLAPAGGANSPPPPLGSSSSSEPFPKELRRSGSLPESLTRELERAPQITPPPGAAADSRAPSGPSAFGLHE